MSEGFDYEAHRKMQQGNPDKALLVSFEYAPEKQRDGSFVNVEMIRIWVDKNQEVVRKVTPEDKVRFADRYASFLKGEEAPPDGTPIRMCAFATPADVAACMAEIIYTLQQLVETNDDRLSKARLLNLKYAANDWLKAQQRHGYVAELREEINKLKAQIEMLKERQQPSVETPEAPKRRGRPSKVKDAENTTGAG